jgi:hypothetical protein
LIVLRVDTDGVKEVIYVRFEVLTVGQMKVLFFWYVVPCQRSGGACCLYVEGLAFEVGPEDGGSTILLSSDNNLPVDTAQHPRRPESSSEFYSLKQMYSFKLYVRSFWQKRSQSSDVTVISQQTDQEPCHCC